MDSDAYAVVIGIVFMFAVYLLPTIVAFWRTHPNRWVIFALNFFLGATGIIWFGCLIWAFMAVHITNDPNGSNGGESGLNLAANDIVPVRLVSDPPAPQTPPPLPGSLPPPDDALARLERLKKLLDDGAIDRAQFERMRDDLIQ